MFDTFSCKDWFRQIMETVIKKIFCPLVLVALIAWSLINQFWIQSVKSDNNIELMSNIILLESNSSQGNATATKSSRFCNLQFYLDTGK